MLGYLALCGIFIAMVLACFAFAISELVRPKDPGPLPIDIRRDIQHRYFARLLRRPPAPARDILAGEVRPGSPFRSVRMSDGARIGSTRDGVVVHGDGTLLPGARAESFVCDGTATVGAASFVEHHAEGGRELILDVGAAVGGRATAGERIVLSPGSSVQFAAAPIIRTTGGPVSEPFQGLPEWDPEMYPDLEWLLSIGTPLDRAVRDLSSGAGRRIDGVDALRHAELGPLRSREAIPLEGAFAPTWLGASQAWYLGAGTVRVRGDLILPGRSLVPFHLIVEGTLATGRHVEFHGSIHAWRDIALGDGTRVEQSVTARGAVRIGDGCAVGECVSAGDDAEAGSGTWIGGPDGGGFASSGAVKLGPGTVICNKLYAERGAHVRDYSPSLTYERIGV